MNMYSTIKSFALGNLSVVQVMPDFYCKMLLNFIIQISRALAFAHQHGVVHGNLDLSKVLVQRMRPRDGSGTMECSWFKLVNLEPFRVFSLMREHL